MFCRNLPNFGQNFQKMLPSRLFCDYIHGLHLFDNFGVFNINIEDIVRKNSEKITKNDPSFSYIEIKTPKIVFIISSEWSWILTFRKKRWNHSNEFFKISLTYFLTPDPPYRLKITCTGSEVSTSREICSSEDTVSAVSWLSTAVILAYDKHK